MSDTNDPMAEIKASFFIECEELLEALQDGLQALDECDSDTETINVVFRAVHSIKGGAGAFGLEALVRFAHRFETVLDEVRAGRMAADVDALKVFFQCADHLSDLVRISRDAGELPEAKTKELLASLDGLLGEENGSEEAEDEEEEIDFQPAILSLDFDDDDSETVTEETTFPLEESSKHQRRYSITFKPDTELFETGNEPFQVFRALEEMGKCTITCQTNELPDLKDIAPESSYLKWIIDLQTDADNDEVSAAFEFVEGLGKLDIEARDNKDNEKKLEPVLSRDLDIPAQSEPQVERAEPQYARRQVRACCLKHH